MWPPNPCQRQSCPHISNSQNRGPVQVSKELNTERVIWRIDVTVTKKRMLLERWALLDSFNDLLSLWEKTL